MPSKNDSTTEHQAIKPNAPAPDSPIRPGAAGNPYAMPVSEPADPKSQPSQPATKPLDSGNEDPGAEAEEIRHHGTP